MQSSSNKGSAKQDIINRGWVLYSIFIIIGFAIAARLVWVQYFSSDVRHNDEVMDVGVFRMDSIPAHRGAILARGGESLATSSLRYYPLFDFVSEGFTETKKEVVKREVDSLCRVLARYFSPEDATKSGYEYIDERGYREIFNRYIAEGKERGATIFPRKVTLDEWRMMKKRFPIMNFSIGCVYSEQYSDDRIYTSDDLAYQVIGRSGEYTLPNGRRMKSRAFGIEHLYDNHLSGHNGAVVNQRIAHGFWARVDDKRNRMPVDGGDVVTTIDINLQKMATDRLREALISQHGSYGVAMVMEAATGNILCMVNLSSGKERGVEYTERFYNHALGSATTPGSTMKLATTMALLEIGGFTLDTKINTEHSNPKRAVKVGYATVFDSHDAGAETGGMVTLKDGFAHSSNVFYAKAVYDNFKDKPEVYTSYLEKLLFNSYVGMQEYGETRGRMPLADSPEWKKGGNTGTRLPIIAYGYEVTLPPIHTLTFYNGVANGGRMVAPRIVDRIERNGEVIERMPVVTLVDKMCSESTCAALCECLAAAATPERTMYKLRGLPVSVGCKTGTAQLWGDFLSLSTIDQENMKGGLNKSDGYYLGSMIAMFPIEAPKYTVMVCMAKQSTTEHPTYYGAALAGGTVHDIIEYVYANDPTLHATIDKAEIPHLPNNIKTGYSHAVQTVGSEFMNDVCVVDPQSEWSVATIDDSGTVTLEPRKVEDGLVPNVVGMGLSDALYLLERTGLKVSHTGKGRVVRQSIVAGSVLSRAPKNIHITLER